MNNIDGIPNSNDRSNVDMNQPLDGKGFTKDFFSQIPHLYSNRK